MIASGVSPSPMSAPRPNVFTTPTMSLNFNSSTLVSPSARVANPSTPSNINGLSSMVVVAIANVPFTSYPLFPNTQSGPNDSTSFFHGFAWFGGHIPPSSPYVGPSPTYAGVPFGIQNPF